MNNANRERLDDFLRSLEQALGRSGSQSEGILDEMRADLEAHVKGYQAEGLSEDKAVGHALGEMGNPYELAHHVRQQIPPFQGKVLTSIRYVAAGGLICWTLFMMWCFRAGSYGLSGPVVSMAVILLHLPVILLLWPRIVWKKNWLFGLIPAGLSLALIMFLATRSVKYEETIAFPIPETDEEVAVLKQETLKQLAEPAGSGYGRILPALMLTGFGMVTIVLLIAMQQRFQRRVVLLAVLLAVVCVEVPYQGEELLFRRERKRVADYMEASLGEQGAYPSDEAFRANGPKLTSPYTAILFDEGQAGYRIFWSRPLRSGYSINCMSEDGQVWIQD